MLQQFNTKQTSETVKTVIYTDAKVSAFIKSWFTKLCEEFFLVMLALFSVSTPLLYIATLLLLLLFFFSLVIYHLLMK